jgi:hypothetical protein
VPTTIEKQIPILVEWSRDDAATGGERFRLWDTGHAIPSPRAGVIRAEILIDGSWEEMSFNTVWGKQHDRRGQGTWLKQKANRHFSRDTGTQEFQVRYIVAEQ